MIGWARVAMMRAQLLVFNKLRNLHFLHFALFGAFCRGKALRSDCYLRRYWMGRLKRLRTILPSLSWAGFHFGICFRTRTPSS